MNDNAMSVGVTIKIEMDIRDRLTVNQKDVAALNFIRHPGRYVFRRYYLNGLRSHIMAVLDPEAVTIERVGIVEKGLRRYPKARPIKMLRIFRSRFHGLADVLREIERFKIAHKFLKSRHLALSNEFVVEYRVGGRSEIMLCGLQEYVPGVALDPWTPMRRGYVFELVRRLMEYRSDGPRFSAGYLERAIARNGLHFVTAVKKMVQESGYIPDIAGVRNLLVTPEGEIKLVDINNISPTECGADIFIDDKGYPVCDKSMEALFLLEGHFLNCSADGNAPFYKAYLDPKRMRAVSKRHVKFHRALIQKASEENR